MPEPRKPRQQTPRGVHPAPPQLREWRGDWLYAVILRRAEQQWSLRNRELRGIGDTDAVPYWQCVLVEEYGESEASMCRGDVLRAWQVDNNGLLEIPLNEHARQIQKIEDRTFPFILMKFHIHSNRRYVVLGHTKASTDGSGFVYRVEDPGVDAQLVPDQSFGFWMS